jgi:osmoprotectant transport system permease protein
MGQRTLRRGISLIAIIAIIWALLRGIGLQTLAEHADDLAYYAGRHLMLVAYSMALAIVIGVPAGIVLSRPAFGRSAERFMQVFNIGNTIPSLAVLAIALGIFGIGDLPAIAALFLASLLPITRNTYEGIKSVPPSLREAARGLGMTGLQSLARVELPHALPIMIGGVRTALAINVGTAPLAYLIGADSLGSLIFPGIYLDNQSLLLMGAGSTAIVALALDGLIAAGSRHWLFRHGGSV